MDDKEKFAAIIGIRVYPSWEKEAMEGAKKRGKILSEFIYDCIEAGWEKVTREQTVKQNTDKTV